MAKVVPAPYSHWWTQEDPKDLLSRVQDAYTVLLGSNQGRGRAYGSYYRLYAQPSNEVNALGGGSNDTLSTTGYQSTERRLSLPLCQSAIDSMISDLAMDRPRPFFCTNGGTYEAQDKAKKLQAFTDGAFYETDFYAKKEFIEKCALIYGDGFAYVFTDKDQRIALRSMPPSHILVDDEDARGGDPRSLMMWDREDKDVLIQMFPKAKEKILETYAKIAIAASSSARRSLSNRMRVIHAWHLPSFSIKETDEKPEGVGQGAAKLKKGEVVTTKAGKDGEAVKPRTDGRHVVFVPGADGCLILDEPWFRQDFPLAKLSCNPDPQHYWSQGIPQQLGQMQADINTGERRMQKSEHLHSNPHWITYRGAQMQFGALNSGMGTEIRCAGPGLEPKLETFAAVHPEFVQRQETKIQRFYQMSGRSQLAATSQKPAGLNSGEAQRVYSDIGDKRFASTTKRDEALCVAVADLFIQQAIEIARTTGSYPVEYTEHKAHITNGAPIESFDFKDLDYESLKYVIQISPTDSLANTVPGRIQRVTEMMQSGAMPDPEEGYRLMEIPDTSAYFKRRFARKNLADKMVNAILTSGDFVPPNPFLDLDYALEVVTMEIAEAQLATDSKPARISQLMDWQQAVVDLQNAAKNAIAAATAPPPPAPGAPMPQNVGPRPVQAPVNPGAPLQ